MPTVEENQLVINYEQCYFGLVLGRSFFTARVFLVEISLLFLEITGHLLVIILYVYITV